MTETKNDNGLLRRKLQNALIKSRLDKAQRKLAVRTRVLAIQVAEIQKTVNGLIRFVSTIAINGEREKNSEGDSDVEQAET